MTLSLPQGFSHRAATLEDVAACVEVINARLMRDIGASPMTIEGLRTAWNEPGFDLEASTRLVIDPKGRVVARAVIFDNYNPPAKVRVSGDVHPDCAQMGIGRWLMAWSEARGRQAIARCPEGTRVALTSYCHQEATERRALLTRCGFEPVRHSFLMGIELSTPTGSAKPVEGIQFRLYRHDEDLETMVRNDIEAFRDHWGYIETPFEEELGHFRHFIEHMEGGYDPALCFVAFDGDEMVGHSLCVPQKEGDPKTGYVDTLAVRSPWRRRGIARALLLMTFDALRARGNTDAVLHVDGESLTGATGLYTSVGMNPRRTSITFEKTIRPGRDLSTTGTD